MSHRGHKGRCFRSHRKTKVRKARTGERYEHPIRYKVPRLIMPFLTGAIGSRNQHRAGFDLLAQAITRFRAWRTKTGNKGPDIRAEGQPAGL